MHALHRRLIVTKVISKASLSASTGLYEMVSSMDSMVPLALTMVVGTSSVLARLHSAATASRFAGPMLHATPWHSSDAIAFTAPFAATIAFFARLSLWLSCTMALAQ